MGDIASQIKLARSNAALLAQGVEVSEKAAQAAAFANQPQYLQDVEEYLDMPLAIPAVASVLYGLASMYMSGRAPSPQALLQGAGPFIVGIPFLAAYAAIQYPTSSLVQSVSSAFDSFPSISPAAALFGVAAAGASLYLGASAQAAAMEGALALGVYIIYGRLLAMLPAPPPQ